MSSGGRVGSGSGRLAFLVAQVGGFAAIRFADRVAAAGVTPPPAGLLRAVADGRCPMSPSDEIIRG
jgi:hypothetical protein